MFYTEVVNGHNMLARSRVMKDWQRLVEKREDLAERGRSGGLARAKRQPTKEVSKQVSEEKEVEVSLEELVKIQTEARAVCEAFGVTAGGYKSDWDQMEIHLFPFLNCDLCWVRVIHYYPFQRSYFSFPEQKPVIRGQ
jgi:predicted Zn-dependent protease